MAEREEEDRKDSKKKDKDKEKGYVAFHSDDSDAFEEEIEETRQKGKKVKREKSRTLGLPRIKTKKKKEKEKEKEKEKDKKSKKKSESLSPTHATKKPIFGVPLAQAVKQSKYPDGVELPKILRDGIVYIEENGLGIEGIYRVPGAKSKVDILKELFNDGKPVDLKEYEPEVVAGVIKSYLRDLPENILTNNLLPKFNELVGMQDKKDQLERTKNLLPDLPSVNRTLLAWIFTHMGHVIDRGSENKMSIQNVSIVLSPTMGINHGVLFIFLSNVSELFPDTQLKKYTGPLTFRIEEDEADLPSSPDAIASALAKQEAILAQLHEKLNSTKDNDDEEGQHELLWEVQRKVTQLKRQLRVAKKAAQGKHKEKEKPNKVEEKDDKEEEIKLLEASEAELIMEQEELMLIGEELRQKIANERREIKRLQEEIASILQEQESEQVLSDAASVSDSSDSETEVDESELESIMQDLIKQNEELEKKNSKLCQEIHEQRETCAEMKVQIRILEQKKLEAEQKLEQEKALHERNGKNSKNDIDDLKLTEDEVKLMTAKHRRQNFHSRALTT